MENKEQSFDVVERIKHASNRMRDAQAEVRGLERFLEVVSNEASHALLLQHKATENQDDKN